MTKRAVAIAICVVTAILAIGGYLVAASLPILGGIGFLAFVVAAILLALGPDRSWSRAEDVRRAHEHEEHPMPEGPAPPFQS
jgi:uncharacterized protein (DUF58 family)